MKKQVTLLLSCIAVVIWGIAQPALHKSSERFFEKNYLEKYTNTHYDNGKIDIIKHKEPYPLKQIPTKSQKGVDWWEPDTVYNYYCDKVFYRHIYSYENGNNTASLRQVWDNEQWMDNILDSYVYDTSNNLIETNGYWWNTIEKEWNHIMKDIYIYDSQNNIIEVISKKGSWGVLINDTKDTYTYDSQNNITEDLYQSWESGKWINISVCILTYDDKNNRTESLVQLWDNDKWLDYTKAIYDYDIYNNRTGWIQQKWDTSWTNFDKVVFTYNTNNKMCARLSQFWNETQWENEDSVSFILDAQNNLISQIHIWWSNKWENELRVNYSYDENNNATSGNFQLWEEETWVDAGPGVAVYFLFYYNNMQSMKILSPGHRFTATYIIKPTSCKITATAGANGTITPNGEVTVTIGEDQTFTFSANSGFEIEKVLIDGTNDTAAVIAGTYTFENVTADHTISVSFKKTTGIAEITNGQFRLYPNPTDGKLLIESGNLFVEKVEIYDIHGRNVLSRTPYLSPVTVIDISHLPSGTYFVKLKTATEELTKKVIKE